MTKQAMIAVAFSLLLATSGWTLKEVVSLKVQVAVLGEKLDNHIGNGKLAKLP